jgi:glycosyltransferase involved in cell wall biosynthesis
MLSIIIPTLDEENYLPLLLESISRARAKGEEEDLSSSPKKQNFNNYEIIIADNNSEDKTVEIARKYGCKIVPGGLPAKGRNEGAKEAKGDLLLFLDADLILPEDFLEKFLKEFKEKNLDIASTDLEFLTDKKIYKIMARLGNLLFRWTQNYFPYITECVLVRKDFHQKIGGFDEEIKLLEDIVYVRKARKIGKFEHLSSIKFYTSPRRFEKDGVVKTLLKYLLANIYLTIFGPIKSDIFNYHFGHYSKNKKNRV